MLVSVVIPSFNRAHLLPITIPTYFQDGVGEVIIVDDCSKDDTENVVQELKKIYSNLIYCRNEKNSKQPFAKNVGISKAQFPYIYFGDDDSILYQNSIPNLVKVMEEMKADIVGAQFLALFFKEQLADLDKFISYYDNRIAENPEQLVNLTDMITNFTCVVRYPMKVPFCHAACLCKAEVARQILFDVNYIGNAYREETDFLIRATLSGHRIYYTSTAKQINLPAFMSTGGARGGSHWRWAKIAIRNNDYFVDKNYGAIQKMFGLKRSKQQMKKMFRQQIFSQVVMKYFMDFLDKTGLFPILYKLKHPK